MFANWYAELNLFSLATLPPVSDRKNCTLIGHEPWKYGKIFFTKTEWVQ